jgi:hypothetical protein
MTACASVRIVIPRFKLSRTHEIFIHNGISYLHATSLITHGLFHTYIHTHTHRLQYTSKSIVTLIFHSIVFRDYPIRNCVIWLQHNSFKKEKGCGIVMRINLRSFMWPLACLMLWTGVEIENSLKWKTEIPNWMLTLSIFIFSSSSLQI